MWCRSLWGSKLRRVLFPILSTQTGPAYQDGGNQRPTLAPASSSLGAGGLSPSLGNRSGGSERRPCVAGRVPQTCGLRQSDSITHHWRALGFY